MRKMLNKKGFTLAELLVVIAIIAVLIAIAIPVFSAQTDKAQQAVYQANARAAYAEVVANAIAENDYTGDTITYDGVDYAVAPKSGSDNKVWTVEVDADDADPASYTFGE